MPSLVQYAHYPDYIVTSPAPHVAQVLINRPTRHNAFTERMWKHLGELFGQLSHDADVRAIILSGVGADFTVGLDMHDASQGDILNGPPGEGVDVARRAQRIRRYIDEFQACVGSIEKCEKPVIIVLHGFSYGIAIDIASCADIRLCTSGTTFSVKEVDVGIAADLGTLSRLPKIVGNASWVKDVCMSARPFSADEALNVGFVSRVVEDRTEDALRMAEVLADKSPVAVQGTKEVLNYARDHGVGDSLRQTGTWNAASIQTRDVVEAVEAWRKKRSARFEKL